MNTPDQDIPERWASVVMVAECTFERLTALHRLSSTCHEFRFVRSSGTLDELLASCRRFESCVLIVEGTTIAQATAADISELLRRPRVRLLARVDQRANGDLWELMTSGCFGFLTDETTLPQLRKMLFSVMRGEMWFPRRLVSQVFQALLVKQNSNSLSRREREVLALLSQKLTNKEIAERLFISQETLRWHLRNLYAKTRVQGRDKLIRYANEFNGTIPTLITERSYLERTHIVDESRLLLKSLGNS
jgi:DNA-binding NarL/FixJ family response regulator